MKMMRLSSQLAEHDKWLHQIRGSNLDTLSTYQTIVNRYGQLQRLKFFTTTVSFVEVEP